MSGRCTATASRFITLIAPLITPLITTLIAALVFSLSLPGAALAQDDSSGAPPSWADASPAPRHRSEADWLVDVGWQTAEELFTPLAARDYAIGDREQFIPLGTLSGASTPFVLRHRSAHAYFWFEPRLRVDQSDLREAADFFEEHIWRVNEAFYGGADLSGLTGDGQVHILHQRTLWSDVMGAFSPDDQCPRQLCPESNQRAVLYISQDLAPLGTQDYLTTLAHEHQHMMQYAVDGNEARWLNEGLSQLAEHLNGFSPDIIAGNSMVEFLDDPDLALADWSFAPSHVGRHYGASYLFLLYLYEHYGPEFTRTLARADGDGLIAVESLLRASGVPGGVDAVFADWIVANLLDDASVAEGQYVYRTLDLPATITPRPMTDGEARVTATDLIQQYGADYLLLDTPGRYRLSFQGSQTAPLLDTAPASADWMWWSNSFDSSATRLTGEFDLSALSRTTLEFSAWWDIEEGYDWFHVLVSDDGGQRWEVVGGALALSGGDAKAPGAYYSGYSTRWRREAIDLSAYAGQKVLIRFEYLTDASENLSGVALDDFAIRDLGYRDDVEHAQSIWRAEGFLRVPRALPQRWTVALIQERRDGRIGVRRMPIDAYAAGSMEFTVTANRPLTVAIGAMAAFSKAPATYDLIVERLD